MRALVAAARTSVTDSRDDRRWARGRMKRQEHRWPRRLAEVEVRGDVAELWSALGHEGPRVGPAVVGGVQPRALEKVVLDELEVRIERERLMVDVALTGVGTDHQGRNAKAVALAVDRRRDDVLVEA